MAYQVRWLETDARFTVAPGESVLDAALRQQIALPHDCRFGGCGSCRATLLDGRVHYAEPPFALSPDDEARGDMLACQARPLSDLVLSVAPARAGSPPTRLRATVEGLRPLAADVLHLQLRLPDDVDLVYAPGQYLNVLLDDARHRSFSMASAPQGNRVDCHVRRIGGGRFTDQTLASLRAGDALDVEVPLGPFRYHAEDDRPLVMLATGTGLAPFKAMLESLMDRDDCPPVRLYWGMRREDELYLHHEITAWGERFDDFVYVPVLSRASESWAGRRGHVQQALRDDLSDLSEHAVYLCGSAAMVQDVRRVALDLGASAEHLYSDSFTPQA